MKPEDFHFSMLMPYELGLMAFVLYSALCYFIGYWHGMQPPKRRG